MIVEEVSISDFRALRSSEFENNIKCYDHRGGLDFRFPSCSEFGVKKEHKVVMIIEEVPTSNF